MIGASQHRLVTSRQRGVGTMIAVAILAACATGDAPVDDEAGSIEPPPDAPHSRDTSQTPEAQADDGPTCGACTADTDCYQSCGAPPEGMAWCCDTAMSSCYPAQSCADPDAGGTD